MPRVRELRLDARTAARAGALDRDRFPGDPADRLIYAAAVELGVRLVSRDTDIAAFDPAQSSGSRATRLAAQGVLGEAERYQSTGTSPRGGRVRLARP